MPSKVFTRVHMPSDMQKINRLLESVAQIWWRQHERLQEYPHHIPGDQDNNGSEVEGVPLMKCMPNFSTLHQLMYSTVMLHWSLYAPLPPSQRVTLTQWLQMNAGLAGSDASEKGREEEVFKKAKKQRSQDDPLRYMLRLIYQVISRAFIPQLQIWHAPQQQSLGKLPPGPKDIDEANEPTDGDETKEQNMEGWANLAGGGFSSSGGTLGSTVTYRHLRSIHCETTTTKWASPVNSRVSSRPVMDSGLPPPPSVLECEAPAAVTAASPCSFAPAVTAGAIQSRNNMKPAGSERVWLTLQDSLLMFAKKPQNWAPYAFVHLAQVVTRNVDSQTFTLTLVAKQDVPPPEVSLPKTERKRLLLERLSFRVNRSQSHRLNCR